MWASCMYRSKITDQFIQDYQLFGNRVKEGPEFFLGDERDQPTFREEEGEEGGGGGGGGEEEEEEEVGGGGESSSSSYTEAKETSDWCVEDDDARAYPFMSTAALSSMFL